MRTICGTILVAVSAMATANAETKFLDESARAEVARRAAAESIVLLKNENATLPLPANAAVTVAQPWPWVFSGGGSGFVLPKHAVDLAEGLLESGFDVVSNANCAVLVVSRFCREGVDSPPEDVRLNEEEAAALDRFKRSGANRIVVVLNVACGFDVEAMANDPAVGAIIHAWLPGQEGGRALADILSGKVNPSGRLAATLGNPADWPSDRHFMDSSFYVPYEEDIFVGYRWFETIPGEKEKAVYPFGHGLSYTKWMIKDEGWGMRDENIEVTVRVTNAGKIGGRHSVLLFSGVTGGAVDHPARELRGYAKTRLLKPGESETLEISFAKNDLAYFADAGERAGSWVIDKGEYALYLGGSVREAEKVGSFQIQEAQVVSSPGLKLNPAQLASRMKADGSCEKSKVVYDGPRRSCDSDRCPAAASSDGLHYSPDFVGCGKMPPLKPLPPQLNDVARGTLSLDDFIATLTPQQQCQLCFHVWNPSHPSRRVCIGGIPFARGITPVVLENAGCGVARRNGYATAFPCSALVACSFDSALQEEVGFAIGSECAEADVDLLQGPGMNIHRHPLCGRNFEYFSEDPLVSGYAAVAYVNGLKRTGTLSCLKHFAANNRENFRDHVSSVVSERALREIYLKGFELAVKNSRPESVMTGYNRVNGRRCGAFHGLVQGVLRDEWGFDGVVMSDFGAKTLCWEEIAAGSDIHMLTYPPGSEQDLQAHVFKWNVVPAEYFHSSVKRLLTLVMSSRRFKRSIGE